MTAPPRFESRWPSTIAVLGAAALYLTLPNQLVLGPPFVRYLVPALELAVLIPLALTTLVLSTVSILTLLLVAARAVNILH